MFKWIKYIILACIIFIVGILVIVAITLIYEYTGIPITFLFPCIISIGIMAYFLKDKFN